MADPNKTTRVLPSHHDFYQGFAVAVGYVAREADRPSLAKDIMVSNGITLADLQAAGVEDYDLVPIREAMA